MDFRKGFLANEKEAFGRFYEIADKNAYAWLVRNLPAFKALARDRVFNPAKIRDGHSIDLETFGRDIEMARQRTGDRERGHTGR